MVFAIGQLVESFILTPVLVGDRIGLHPVAVIFALMAGGQLAGFTGVLIGLPVAAVLLVFGRRIVNAYLTTDVYNAD
jgi:predicted PurR-regulated permease PerM